MLMRPRQYNYVRNQLIFLAQLAEIVSNWNIQTSNEHDFYPVSRFYQGERSHEILAVCTRTFCSLQACLQLIWWLHYFTLKKIFFYFISRKLCTSYLLNTSNALFKNSQTKCWLLQWIFWISPGNSSRHVVPLTILLIITLESNVFSEMWIQFPKD